jgi:hypothetical protein
VTSAFRRGAVFILALTLTIFAVAPHDHESWGAETISAPDSVERVGSCNQTSAVHCHSGRTVHRHDCIGCTRQHSVITLHLARVDHAIGSATALPARTDAGSNSPSVSFAQLRGPPAA